MARSDSLDLTTLSLRPGDGRRLELEISPGGFELAGQSYTVEEPLPARLEVSRTASGHALKLTFTVRMHGPCMRCLEDSAPELAVESREVDQPGSGDEELSSPYVDEGVLDLMRFSHDSLALALPAALLCRPDCAGLCPECGESLNDAEPVDHIHEREPDPRWAKLRELSE